MRSVECIQYSGVVSLQIQVKETCTCLHLVTKFVAELLSGCFNVIGLFAKKDSHPLFSFSVLTGQFSSKWPGSISRAVILNHENW